MAKQHIVIKEELTKDHSKKQIEKIIAYIGNDKILFNELMQCLLSKEPLLEQRAAWPLGYIGRQFPDLLKPFYIQLFKFLDNEKAHDSVKRNILRIFEDIDAPDKHIPFLFDKCIQFIKSEHYSIGIRAFSITCAGRICKKIPELKPELLLVLNEIKNLPQPAAIKHRIKTTLKSL